MTNQPVPISNWTLATGSTPGKRHVYRDTPRHPVTHRRLALIPANIER